MIEEKERCAMPDFESEYKRLIDELAKLEKENRYLHELNTETKRELEAAIARLDMAYLIFRGRR